MAPSASITDTAIDPAALRTAFGTFPTGVVAVCASVYDQPVGMAVSSFVPVSLDPPLVAFCVRKESGTWPMLQLSSRLGISVLAEQHSTAARALASSRADDRFADVRYSVAEGGALEISGCSTFLNCTLENEIDAGDHVIAVLRINSLTTSAAHPPLVFHASRFGTVRHQA